MDINKKELKRRKSPGYRQGERERGKKILRDSKCVSFVW